MIVKIADNIVSPLGFNSEENYSAIKEGRSAIKYYDNKFYLPEPFAASLFGDGDIDQEFACIGNPQLFTDFEKISIISAHKAINEAQIDGSSPRTQFIISTTKGNVSLLGDNPSRFANNRVLLGVSANYITDFFKNPNKPIVVSNACISGVCAQIATIRCLKSNQCDHAVVIGADCLSKFIVSGFQSFKALSPEGCKPFDANRIGLNLGEGAGTIIYSRKNKEEIRASDIVACKGAIRNDANHISGPSRTGEGSYRAMHSILKGSDISDIAFINAHGTSTPYNDEMEAIAIDRAGLLALPVNSLKGYFGHTLGAAGVIETIISMHALSDNIVLGTRGYETCGVTRPLNLSNKHSSTNKNSFIKLLSGFGGCNASILFMKGERLCK